MRYFKKAGAFVAGKRCALTPCTSPQHNFVVVNNQQRGKDGAVWRYMILSLTYVYMIRGFAVMVLCRFVSTNNLHMRYIRIYQELSIFPARSSSLRHVPSHAFATSFIKPNSIPGSIYGRFEVPPTGVKITNTPPGLLP